MSIKVNLFSTATPLVASTSNFYIFIPNLITSLTRVHAAPFPQSTTDVVQVPVGGTSVLLPATKQKYGSWTCQIYDDAWLSTLVNLTAVKAATQALDNVHVLFDVAIVLTDTTSIKPIWVKTLKDCFIEKIDKVQLDWSTPDKPIGWNVTFRYNGIVL